MSVDYECTLRRIFRPESVSDGPSTMELHVHWKHCRRVFQRPNHGILRPIVSADDEPFGASRASHLSFSLPHLSQFRQQMWIYITSLDFPHGISNLLYQQITSLVIDFFYERPAGVCPSLVLLAEINFVHRDYADYDPRPLEIIPPRQLAASGDENSIPDTTTDAPEVDRHLFSFGTILRESTEGWGGDGGDSDSFFDENFILGITSEVDEDNNAGTEMWYMGEGGEVNCSICLEELSEGQEVLTTACEHSYHEQCLLTWLDGNQTCPLCRQPI